MPVAAMPAAVPSQTVPAACAPHACCVHAGGAMRPAAEGGSLSLILPAVDRYVDRTMYLKTQPPADRKKGFGSSDARRRDEFTLDIETEKWRERIGKEVNVS